VRLLPLLCLLLATGCPVAAYRGVYATVQNPKYTLNTKQLCQHPEETLRVAELALPIILEELAKDGWINSVAEATAQLKGKVMVCQVQFPEPCCFWKDNCAAPQQPGGGRYARKAGCTVYESAWVSRTWPPVCQADWPNEPHCDADEPYLWDENLVHELLRIVVSMVMMVNDAGYSHAVWQPGGTEERIKARYRLLMTWSKK